ncbi:hypothetical protein DFA_04433 [Cavenderia fasciculata]|uniref:Purple acid phosphatase n=1 Tax=Cavenderia fasciculata TaxID=261658 RepID=F4PPK2_CACFS|nr:uncharacterized protein DFA_04433 [Cavenderia fasciculata]EGG22315.1 hypothetical protein DFA_04433 [Cavenderia fasciculata]|eukprot:XP_004360166.1 hypothetical protein DFA_04433 [Cavenderia fasciculata]
MFFFVGGFHSKDRCCGNSGLSNTGCLLIKISLLACYYSTFSPLTLNSLKVFQSLSYLPPPPFVEEAFIYKYILSLSLSLSLYQLYSSERYTTRIPIYPLPLHSTHPSLLPVPYKILKSSNIYTYNFNIKTTQRREMTFINNQNHWISIFILLTICICNIALASENGLNAFPQSVKLSLTPVYGQMKVSWFTSLENGVSLVQYSQSQSALQASLMNIKLPAGSSVYTANGTSSAFATESNWFGFSNMVLLESLEPMTTYFYACGGKTATSAWTSVRKFTTGSFGKPTSTGSVTPFTVALYGDMGFGGGFNQTVQVLVDNLDHYDMILHVGDISYADYDRVLQGNQTIWNDFLSTIEPITSSIPYMSTPGNHDVFYSFQAYQQTFNMPGSSNEPWYSFDYNGVHFVSYSTESDISPFTRQYQWLKNDLDTYRSKNPKGWVIAYAHRPYYCSTQWDWCRKQTLRALIESTIGELFQQYNVDMYLAGHTHAYERTQPVYKQLQIGNYQYPGATVHMIVGTPGNQEGLDTNWIYPTPAWSGYRYAELGYATMSIVNDTHLLWQFIADKDQQLIDEQWIVKGYFD